MVVVVDNIASTRDTSYNIIALVAAAAAEAALE